MSLQVAGQSGTVGAQAAVIVVDWTRKSMVSLRADTGATMREQSVLTTEIPEPMANPDQFVEAIVRFASPHMVSGIVVLSRSDSEGEIPRSPLQASRFPIPMMMVPVWRALAHVWAQQFKVFVLLDSSGQGALRLLCRSSSGHVECLGPRDKRLKVLLHAGGELRGGDDDDVLLGLLAGTFSQPAAEEVLGFGEAGGRSRDEVTAWMRDLASTLAASIQLVTRLVDLSAVVCVGRFFDEFGDQFQFTFAEELTRRDLGSLRVVTGGGPANSLSGALALARHDLGRPGASIAVGRRAARLVVSTQHQIQYSTLHPEAHVFHRDCTILGEIAGSRPLLVAVDKHIEDLYGREMQRVLDTHTDCCGCVTVDGSERAKNWMQVERILEEAARVGLPKNGLVLGVGGGVSLDVAGFAASIFRRGVDYVRVPTSLIGLVDVGVGIKQGINAFGKKSILGSFYPAVVNINDPTFLATLPQRHLSCGIAEMIKIAMVRDKDLFETLEWHVSELLVSRFQQSQVAREILLRSEYLMMEELQRNLFETDRARLPDFGHTFGPFMEAASVYAMAHGEAVAIDMLLSTAIAVDKGACGEETFERLHGLITAAGLNLALDGTQPEVLIEALDAARSNRGGALNLVIPLGLGQGGFVQDVSPQELERAVAVVRRSTCDASVVGRPRRDPATMRAVG